MVAASLFIPTLLIILIDFLDKFQLKRIKSGNSEKKRGSFPSV